MGVAQLDGFDFDVGPFAHGDDGEGLRAAPAARLVDDMPWSDGDDDGGWTDEAAQGDWSATGDVERFAASCAERRPRAARRQRRRLQTQGVDLPADAWKRFTPDVVDAKRCQARTWAGGRGDQCKSRFLPGKLLCGEHERHSLRREGLTHGFVTGEIPRGKLLQFLQRAQSREDAVARDEEGVELVKRGAKGRGRCGGKRYYARDRFWCEAAKLDTPVRRLQTGREITHLSDLTEQERKECLERVHLYFKKHRHLWLRAGCAGGFVEPGKGPSLDAQVGDGAFEYNGSDGKCGRVFKWYRKAVFQDQLRALGWTATRLRTGKQVYESVTERQCMEALARTRDLLQRYPQTTSGLEEYAGPQCYPQLAEDKRYRANDPKRAEASTEPATVPAARGQMRCWLQCDKCARWWPVERTAVPAMDPAAYSKGAPGADDPWSSWLDGVQHRYALFKQHHELCLATGLMARAVSQRGLMAVAVAVA